MPEDKGLADSEDLKVFSSKTKDEAKPFSLTKDSEAETKKDLLDDQIKGVPVDKFKSFNKIVSDQPSQTI